MNTDVVEEFTNMVGEFADGVKALVKELATNMTDEKANEIRATIVVLNELNELVDDEFGKLVKGFDEIVDSGTELGFFSNVERVTKKITREGAGRKAMSPEEKLAAKILRAAK